MIMKNSRGVHSTLIYHIVLLLLVAGCAYSQPTNLPAPVAKSVMTDTNGWLTAHTNFLKTNIVAGAGIAIVTNGAPNANGIAIHAMLSGTGMTNVTVYSSNTSSANLVVRGRTGGTNDLQQWRDSNGVPVAQINSNGVFYGNGAGISNVTAVSTPSPYLTNATAYSSNTTDVPLQTYPRTGTGTNAFQTTTTNGTPAFRVQADGDLEITGIIRMDTTNLYAGTGNFGAITSGLYNVGIGFNNFRDLEMGSDNFGVGHGNFANVLTNSLNTGFGYRNFYYLTNGGMNFGVGYRNFYTNSSGDYNMGVGYQNFYFGTNITGSTGIGYANFQRLDQGEYNVGLGYRNMMFLATGSNNVAMPHSAGTNLLTGNNNLFLGTQTRAAAGITDLHNSVVMGVGADVATNDVIILGSTNRVGINTNSPKATLHVFGNLLVESNLQAASVSGDITNQLSIVMTNYVDGMSNKIFTAATNAAVVASYDTMTNYVYVTSNKVYNLATNDAYALAGLAATNNTTYVSNKVYVAATNDAYALAGAASTNYTDAVSNKLFAAATQTATNLGTNYLLLGGGTVYGPVLSTSTTATNGPAANEFVSAQWVRGLLSGGEILYNNTNRHPVNTTYYQAANLTNDDPQVRYYTNTGAGNYLGTGIMSTQRFTTVYSPMVVDIHLSMSGGGAATTLHPEFYYTYDGTNLLGDYECGDQSLVNGSTNLYSFVISFPTIESTNSAGFYVVRRVKVEAQAGANTIVGVHGSGGTPSHISFQNPPDSDFSLGARGALVIDYSGCPAITNSVYDTNTRTFTLQGPDVAAKSSNQVFTGLNEFTSVIATNAAIYSSNNTPALVAYNNVVAQSNLWVQSRITNGTGMWVVAGAVQVVANAITGYLGYDTSSRYVPLVSGASHLMSAGSMTIAVDSNNDQTDRTLTFKANDNAGGGNEWGRMTEAGLWGFNTNSPQAQVHVFASGTNDALRLEGNGGSFVIQSNGVPYTPLTTVNVNSSSTNFIVDFFKSEQIINPVTNDVFLVCSTNRPTDGSVRNSRLIIFPGATARVFGANSNWKWLGATNNPAVSITNVVLVSLKCWGSNETNVIAAMEYQR